MTKSHSINAAPGKSAQKKVTYQNGPRDLKDTVADTLKTERITLNLTQERRKLLDRLRGDLQVRSIGEVMRRAFVLYDNLFNRARIDETIVLRHPERKKDVIVNISLNWKEEGYRAPRDGGDREVVGLRVETTLRDTVVDMIRAKAAPTITELSELALEKYEQVFRHAGQGYQLLTLGREIPGLEDRIETFLELDGSVAHRSGGGFTTLDLEQFRDRKEYSQPDEYVRQMVLREFVKTCSEPVYALTLDADEYFSNFWSGPLWETFLKTNAGHRGKVHRIFLLNPKTFGEEKWKLPLIRRVLKKHEEMGVQCKVLVDDGKLQGWVSKHDTSFLISGDFISESYSLSENSNRPGYVARGANIDRARQLKALWDTLYFNNDDQCKRCTRPTAEK